MGVGDATVNLSDLKIVSNGVNFDGVDDLLTSTSNIGISGTTNRTTLCWIKPQTSTANEAFLELGVNGGGTRWDMQFNDGSQTLRLEVGGDGHTSSLTVPTDKWSLIACVLDGTDLDDCTLYVYNSDGFSKEVSTTSQAINLTDATLKLGSQYSGAFYDGLMKKVWVYNAALTEDNIEDIYNGVAIDTNLVASYDFTLFSMEDQTGTNDLTKQGTNFETTSAIKTALEAARVTANDRYVSCKLNKKLLTAVIEENP